MYFYFSHRSSRSSGEVHQGEEMIGGGPEGLVPVVFVLPVSFSHQVDVLAVIGFVAIES